MVSAQPESHGDKMRVITAGVIIVAVVLLIYIYITSGQNGLFDIVKKFFLYGLIVVIIGLVVWIVMRLLRKEKIDLVANDKKDIIDAAILSKPPMVKDLYVTGDKEHGEFRLGKLIGYCQMQSYKQLDVLAGLSDAQMDEMEKNGEIPSENIIKEDVFVFKKMPWPLSFFEEPKVLRTLEDEHSQLIGDVKVYAVSLISKFSFYWPNRAHLDIVRIDVAVIREAWRGQVHQFLKDAVSIQQRAVGLDAEHKKEIDNRKLLKIPSPMQNEDERGR